MFTDYYQKRVRYAETDKMGYLYYGRYASLYEIGRVEAIRALGVTYKDFEDHHNIIMPVVEMNCRYKYPAFYDDLLTIKTIIKELPSKMITFEHEIYNADKRLLNMGMVKLFFVAKDNNRRVSAPGPLVEALRPYFNPTPNSSN